MFIICSDQHIKVNYSSLIAHQLFFFFSFWPVSWQSAPAIGHPQMVDCTRVVNPGLKSVSENDVVHSGRRKSLSAPSSPPHKLFHHIFRRAAAKSCDYTHTHPQVLIHKQKVCFMRLALSPFPHLSFPYLLYFFFHVCLCWLAVIYRVCL